MVDITVEKTLQGAWRVSAIIAGYRQSIQFFGCTKKEAIRWFKEEFDV